VAYRALTDLAGKASLLAITVVAARRLSAEAFGIFSLASTLGWILAVAADFGIQMHVARAVAKRPGDAVRVLGSWLTVRLATAAASVVLVAIGLIASPTADPYALPILLFTIVYVVSGLVEFLNYFYRGLDRTDVESSLVLGQRLATLTLALLVLAWRPGLTALAIVMLVPVVATLAISLRLASRFAGLDSRVESPLIRPSPPRLQEFWRDVFPIGAGIVLSALYFRIDLFMLGWWQGTVLVGLYNAVFRLIEALRLFPAAALAVVLPRLVRADDGRPLLYVSAGVMAFAAMVTGVLWSSAGWLIPLVYGETYAPAVPAFRILTMSFPLLSLNYALTHQLIAWDRQKAYACLGLVALLVNVALNARLIPARSLEGAAWATFWTEVLITLGCSGVLWLDRGRERAGVTSARVAS